MTFRNKILLIFIFIFSSACSELKPPATDNQGDISTEKESTSDDDNSSVDDGSDFEWPTFDWDNQHKDYITWNKITFDAVSSLGSSLQSVVPSDVLNFCPKYDSLGESDKKLFWISLIAAMVRFESFFNPDTFYVESFKDSNGDRIVSRGLAQLSIESSLGYGCPINDAMELHDPKVNLECTIRILDRWVGRDGVISDNNAGKWLGGARYWAVLRKESTLNKIKDITSNFELCK